MKSCDAIRLKKWAVALLVASCLCACNTDPIYVEHLLWTVPQWSLRGQVKDANNQPIQNASIEVHVYDTIQDAPQYSCLAKVASPVYDSFNCIVSTDKDGFYSFWLVYNFTSPNASVFVCAQAKKYQPDSAYVNANILPVPTDSMDGDYRSLGPVEVEDIILRPKK